MSEIIIDEQFRFLLPELELDTYRGLEANILVNGCLFPLVLWNGILIDGYNRYKICTEHDIPFDTINMEFDTREEAIIWIIRNQIERRNLTPIQLSYFRGLHYTADKELHGGDRRSEDKFSSVQNAHLKSGSTAGRLAGQYNVSRDTIKRDEKLAQALNKMGEKYLEAKRKILSGKISVNKSKLEALASAPDEKIEAFVAEIEGGTYNRRAISTAKRDEINNILEEFPEVQKLNSIINSFAKDISTHVQEIKSGNPAELKSTIRSYIDELEKLYRSI